MNRVWVAGEPRALAEALRKQLISSLKALRFSKADVSVSLVGDAEIRRLNRRYRGKDKPTDVLSFSQNTAVVKNRRLLGDIVISVPTAKRQAAQAGRPLGEETAMLGIHGLLHLLGHDHMKKREAAVMFRIQDRLLKKAVRRV